MPSYCYFQKKIVPLSEAKLGAMTNSMHYGTSIFEGIRGNWNEKNQQIYIFRLKEHYERLLQGCRVLRCDLPYTVEDMCRITLEMVRKCDFKEDIYIRPLAYRSSEALGVRLYDLDSDLLIFAMPWGPYLKCDKARCSVSSWRRPEDNVIPPSVKVAGIYVNNALAKTEAVLNGYDEAIMLTPDGHVSEGSGENIFLVIDGKLVTPSTNSSILNGITRRTVIQMAQEEMGITTEERFVDRSELYTCSECFLTGTAAHLTPVAEVDNRKVGDGEIGPITAKLQKLYFDVIRGNNKRYAGWSTPVYEKKPRATAKAGRKA